jgi:hypothetical protein
MAGISDIHDGPISRDRYAEHLAKELARPTRQDTISVKAADAFVVAELLDELAAVYRDEALGRLAREVAVKLYDRLGI